MRRTAEDIECDVRTYCETKRVRVNEFFLDFDKLRSGFVTENQFFRTLWQNLELNFDENDRETLRRKYLKKSGFNYRDFCESVLGKFDSSAFDREPTTQVKDSPEFLGTARSVRPLDTEMEHHLRDILLRMKQYYAYQGLSIRRAYQDFDRHNKAVVTESQFFRNLPGPPDLSAEEITVLIRKYADPDRAGLVNYLNLHNDVEAIQPSQTDLDRLARQYASSVRLNESTAYAVEKEAERRAELKAADEILNRVRIAVVKHGIRTTEFFRDFDKLRTGKCSEAQFSASLTLAVGKQTKLTPSEIAQLANHFCAADGRVCYGEFCDSMESGFSVPHLDKNVTAEVRLPPKGSLYRSLPRLSDAEEARVQSILDRLANEVLRRRILLYPFFRDFDRSTAYTRVISKLQFQRVLAALELRVSPSDAELLCRKFAEPSQTDSVNYPAFIEHVDPEYKASTQDGPQKDEPEVLPAPTGFSESGPFGGSSLKDLQNGQSRAESLHQQAVDFDDLIARIRHCVITNRVRIKDYVEDFDQLRSGLITIPQFRRAMSSIGFSKLGFHDLTDYQFQLLISAFQDMSQKDKFRWVDFANEVERAVAPAGLEKNPTAKVPPPEAFLVPRPGTIEWQHTSEEHQSLAGEAMERIGKRVKEYNVSCRPTFKSFDKHNRGVISRSQFTQALTMLELHCSKDEMDAIAALFSCDDGIDYVKFLDLVEPINSSPYMYPEHIKAIRKLNEHATLPEKQPRGNAEEVLEKVQNKAFERRLRLKDLFVDFDKLRSGCVKQDTFRRALGTAKLELLEAELSILEDHYASTKERGAVDYAKFCADVEAVFVTRGLEKDPLKEHTSHVVRPEFTLVQLSSDEQLKVDSSIQRIAKRVRERRLQLYPLFEDFDRVRNGTVTPNQFRRVLFALEMNDLINNEEANLLAKAHHQKIGYDGNFNYLAFCDSVYRCAGIETRMP